jgi:hypothetical protein
MQYHRPWFALLLPGDYRVTLGRDDMACRIPCAKQPAKLPQILSRQEVGQLFTATTNLQHQALLETTCGAGLRVSETLHLQITDIDSQRMCLRIEQGKRGKDRSTVLSPQLLQELLTYWRVHRPAPWLFPGRHGQPLTRKMAHHIFHQAKDRAGITNGGGMHSLRHATATHMLMAGIDVRSVQDWMGHKRIENTLRYLHIIDAHRGTLISTFFGFFVELCVTIPHIYAKVAFFASGAGGYGHSGAAGTSPHQPTGAHHTQGLCVSAPSVRVSASSVPVGRRLAQVHPALKGVVYGTA